MRAVAGLALVVGCANVHDPAPGLHSIPRCDGAPPVTIAWSGPPPGTADDCAAACGNPYSTACAPADPGTLRCATSMSGGPGGGTCVVAASVPAPVARFHGGRVVENAKLYVLWWGDRSRISFPLSRPHSGLEDFFREALDSAWLSGLSQYDAAGQHIGRGSYAGARTLRDPGSGVISSADISRALATALDEGLLSSLDANTIAAVILPPGVALVDRGKSGCTDFLGYHDVVRGMPFFVLPDCSAQPFEHPLLGTIVPDFNDATIAASHELIETITDPEEGTGWTIRPEWELADLCRHEFSLGEFAVTMMWDERAASCAGVSRAAQDFDLRFADRDAILAPSPAHFVVETETTAGAPQPLRLTAAAPPGIDVSIRPEIISSGESAVITATSHTDADHAQIVIRAEGLTTHTAALLVRARSSGCSHTGAAPWALLPLLALKRKRPRSEEQGR